MYGGTSVAHARHKGSPPSLSLQKKTTAPASNHSAPPHTPKDRAHTFRTPKDRHCGLRHRHEAATGRWWALVTPGGWAGGGGGACW